MRTRRWFVVFLSGWWWLSSGPAVAQEAKLLASEAPYYAGVPIDLQIVAEGFEESPQPTIEVDPPKQGHLELTSVSPNVSTSVQIINGSMKQWKSVRFVFNYRFLANQTGTVTIGPFRVQQDNNKTVVEAATFELREIPTGGDQRFMLLLPDTPVVMGQRIPVRLQWWIQDDLVENLVSQEAVVPLFDMVENFRFLDEEQEEAKNAIIIQTPSGPMKFPASILRTTWKDKSYVVLTVTRTMIPLKAGQQAIPPASMILEEAVRWRQTLFGQRTASHVRKLRAIDKERTLTVRSLPTEGKPPSFAGAIGQGFTLEVVAQRTVVQVGEPIQLTITLRGDAAIATASLPPLDKGGGLSPQDFRVPEGETSGVVREGSKRFLVAVRVLHEGVKEIPAIAYSWFDPDRGTYQTTHSQPIALSVGAARMVTAGDVVRKPEAAKDRQENGSKPLEEKAATPAAPSAQPEKNQPTFTLTGADLAIVQDPRILLGGSGSWLTATWVQILCYLLGVVVTTLAIWRRRQAKLDPKITARQKAMRLQKAKVANASSVGEIADALRQMAALAQSLPRQELDALLETCDHLIFAPHGQQVGIDAGLRQKALDLAQRIMEATP